jgi:acetate kinase
MNILTINTGSSSVRLGFFKKDADGLKRLAARHLKNGSESSENHLKHSIKEKKGNIDVVAHRIVHGGSTLTESCIVDEHIEKEIEGLSFLAPLHNPVALKWVRTCRVVIGADIPQIAVFDTAFYASMPNVSKTYALPKDLCSTHDIRRYGFHGIAHRAMVKRHKELSPDNRRIISIQLGSGCSITAVKDGQPLDTSMGFSPNEGLVMSTRSGDIDSGVLLYLAENAGLSMNEIDRMLNRSSGLLGVSDISDDMKILLESEDPGARLAVELYCYRIKKYIGAYMAALGGVDAVLFGGGVGENAPQIRKRIFENMEWCDILLDQSANESAVGKEDHISSEKSRVDVMVIPVDEAAVLAEEAVNIMERL